jgi:CRISPR system Cascade subunit CasB
MSNPDGFVNMVIRKLQDDETKKSRDTAFRPAMRVANTDTKGISKSWQHFTRYCDITNEKELKAFALIGSALAKSGNPPKANGHLEIGTALNVYYSAKGRNNNDEYGIDKAAKARFLRLLACDTTEEACTILRPMLNLINSDGGTIPIDYIRLLKDLLAGDEKFNEQIKPRWAKNFYQGIKEAEE